MEVRFAPIFICRLYAVYAKGECLRRMFSERMPLANVFDDFNYEVGIMIPIAIGRNYAVGIKPKVFQLRSSLILCRYQVCIEKTFITEFQSFIYLKLTYFALFLFNFKLSS
jgi:hypothetical protein